MVGLGIALSGLEAQQSVIAVTSHNVANASTPGYSDQVATLVANPPYSPPALHQNNGPGQYGMGVTVGSITRQTSQFLSLQTWSNNGELGDSNQTTQTLNQVEALLNEPSSTGLNNQLDQFWNAWQSLGNDPQSTAARSQVVAAGQALTSQFNQLDSQLSTMQGNLDASVSQQVGVVNQLSGQIANLNQLISADTAAGQHPNDLEDQRDQLVGQLANVIPVSVSWQKNGEVTVSAGTVAVVDGSQVLQLQATPNPANHNYQALSWGPGGVAATFTGGMMGALLNLRDQTIPGYRSQLDQLAAGIAGQVNTLQTGGSDLQGNPGQAFFEPSSGTVTAANISVNPALASNPGLVAAAATPFQGSGDGSNAVQIADLQNSAFLDGNTSTPSDFLASFVGQLGSDAAAAQSAQTNAQTLQQSISQQQQQVSGVSVDQEMTTMVEAQNAYAAAAKVSTTIDTMLGDLINMV